MTEREVLERLIQGVPLVRGAGGVDPWPLQVQAGLARRLPEDFPPPPTRRTFRADPWTPTSRTWLGRIMTTPWLCEIVGILGTPGKAADRADRIVDLVSRLSREEDLGRFVPDLAAAAGVLAHVDLDGERGSRGKPRRSNGSGCRRNAGPSNQRGAGRHPAPSLSLRN